MAVRCFSVLLMVFSVVFAITWNGYCLGDEVFARLGLKAWSDGSQGIHYTAICALIMLWAALYLFSITRKRKERNCRSCVVQGIVAIACTAVLFWAI